MPKTEKLTKEKLMQMIKEEWDNVLNEKKDIVPQDKSGTQSADVPMNSQENGGAKDSQKGTKDELVPTDDKGTQSKDVKFNSFDNKNPDKEIATAVEVEAASNTHSKGYTVGMKDSKFTSKSNNPKTSASDPFTNKAKEMNTLDKEQKTEEKTFVETGAKTQKFGGYKPNIKKQAPKSDNDKRIAKAEFELKESYSTKELGEFIISEAMKMATKPAPTKKKVVK